MEAFTDEEYEPIDLSYFFGPQADSVCANPVLYPAKEDIDRSTQEHDWGGNTPKLIEMWSHIKGDNASSFTYIVIGVLLVAALAAGLWSRAKKSRRGKHRR